MLTHVEALRGTWAAIDRQKAAARERQATLPGDAYAAETLKKVEAAEAALDADVEEHVYRTEDIVVTFLDWAEDCLPHVREMVDTPTDRPHERWTTRLRGAIVRVREATVVRYRVLVGGKVQRLGLPRGALNNYLALRATLDDLQEFALDASNMSASTPHESAKGDLAIAGEPLRRPKRTPAQVSADEIKIASYLVANPDATRDEVAQSTGIAAAHVSGSKAWKSVRTSRTTVRSAAAARGTGWSESGSLRDSDED